MSAKPKSKASSRRKSARSSKKSAPPRRRKPAAPPPEPIPADAAVVVEAEVIPPGPPVEHEPAEQLSIPEPSFGPATVQDHGEIEFLLVLTKA